MTHKLLTTLLVLAWMGLIFSFSAQPAEDSSQVSGQVVSFLEWVLRLDLSAYHGVIRKLAHVGAYFVLGAFLTDMFSAYTKRRTIIIRGAFIVALLYAITDEVHQTFIPGRSGEVRDVLIDMIGATIGIGLMFYLKLKQRLL